MKSTKLLMQFTTVFRDVAYMTGILLLENLIQRFIMKKKQSMKIIKNIRHLILMKLTQHEKNIEGVVVTGSKAATALSKKEAGLVFNIDKKELLKAACCNLSESFETNATVDVSFSNAVTGTKQLKMLGLDQNIQVNERTAS
jgi:hypothetical protein